MATGPFLCYRELLPPSSIYMSVFLHVCVDGSGDGCFEEILVTASTTKLSVHRVIRSILKKVTEVELYGRPKSMTKTAIYSQASGHVEDHLVTAFDTGKVVVSRFNCAFESFETVLMFNVEEDATGPGSELRARAVLFERSYGNSAYPKIAADPSGKLIAAIVYGRSCLFAPLRTSMIDVQTPNESVYSSFLVDLTALGLSCVIYDLCFLEGYDQPSLALLAEAAALPVGHCGKIRDTGSICVLAVDVVSKRCSTLWRVDSLPHDSLQIHPIGRSFPCGLLLISMNAVFYVERGKTKALATNSFASITANSKDMDLAPSTIENAEHGLELDLSHWTALDELGTFLGILKDGLIVMLRLAAPETVHFSKPQLSLNVIGHTIKATCIALNLQRNLLFLGSRETDAILLEISRCSTSSNSTSQLKRRKFGSNDVEADEEERELYGEPLSVSLSNLKSSIRYFDYEFRVGDVIPVFGPVLDGLFSTSDENFGVASELARDKGSLSTAQYTPTPMAESYIAGRQLKDSLYTCAGLGDHAGLTNIISGLKTTKVATRDIEGATSIKSLTYGVGDQSITYVFISSDSSRILKYEMNGDKLVITEVGTDTSKFVIVDKTIAAGLVCSNILVQVCGSGLRLLRLPDEAHHQDCFVAAKPAAGGFGGAPKERIVSADILQGWVTAITSDKSLYIFKLDDKTSKLSLYAKAESSASFGGHGKDVIETECSRDKNKTILLSHLFEGGVSCASLFREDIKFSDTLLRSSTNIKPKELNLEEVEDEYFYGKRRFDKKDTDKQPDIDTHMEVSGDRTAHMYLAASDSQSAVVLFNLEELKVVFASKSVRRQETYLVSCVSAPDDTHIESHKKHIREIRVHRMRRMNYDEEVSRLCLVAMFEAGDFGLYRATETISGLISGFLKVEYASAIRKRKAKMKLRRTIWNEPSSNDAVEFEDSNMYSMTRVESLNGYSGLVISGPRPVFISALAGYPFAIPITFPELPYANIGTYSVTPFKVGNVIGISSLWREFEESAVSRNRRTATLGLYREIANTIIHDGGIVSSRKLNVRSTVHRCLEMVSRSDNKIEKALLKKKTFVMCLSDPVEKPFLRDVVTSEEKAKDDEEFGRFFPSLESFASPSEKTGKDPSLKDRRYKLNLVQGGEVVDVFDSFLDGEYVMDIDVLHLELDSTKPDTRRIFLAATTSINEKHGEDSQGSGRLLFFSLTFAMFGDLGQMQQDASNNKCSKPFESGKIMKTLVTDSAAIAAAAMRVSDPLNPSLNPSVANHDKFLDSIRPKLKLEWTGPGPSSIVKQFGKSGEGDLELEPISFYIAHFFITSVSITKDYIILSDALRGTSFLVWRDEDTSLTLQAREGDFFSSVVSSLIRDGPVLGIVVGDDEGNVQQLQYNPRRSSKRLQCTAAMHVGSELSVLLPHRLLSLPSVAEQVNVQVRSISGSSQTSKSNSILYRYGSRLEKSISDRSCLIVATLEGSVAALVPVDERVYQRLLLLQEILCKILATPFNLNPKEFRTYLRSHFRGAKKQGILDGSILWKFVTLDVTTQTEITQTMGTTIDRILDSLQEIEVAINFY